MTDYGNYSYRWTHHGRKDFREFVIDLAHDWDYLLGKISPNGKQYDGEKTKGIIKEHILSCRKHGCYSKEFAREEWDRFKYYNINGEFDYHYGFYKWVEDTKIEEAYEFARYSYLASALSFAKKLMPRLAELLMQELGMAA